MKTLSAFLSVLISGILILSVNGCTGESTAPDGDTLYRALSSEPATLNPFSSTDLYASEIQNYVLEGLLTINIDTYELEPGLAERYEVSEDEMTFTFFMRKDAKWHDGKPVTAEDVKFSFDSIMNPKYKATHMWPYFENIESAEVIDTHTIRFKAKKKYFNNLKVVGLGGFLAIVPKHIYGDPEKKVNKELVGSGPYILENYRQGKNIVLKKNPNWWGIKADHLNQQYRINRLFFRFVKDDNIRMEMVQKGRLDFIELTPEQFVKRAKGPQWENEIVKQQVENRAPKGYGFIGWNLKNQLFQDRDVRVALAHLMNRELMNKKFRYDMSLPATGPWYRQSPYANEDVKPILFDPEKAQNLLLKAGWSDSDKDGVLDKKIDGKTMSFRFSLMFANRDVEKYYTLYKEDLKKAGIDAQLKLIEWNSFIKALDDRKFDAVALAWSGGSVDNDPKQIWHSESARGGGSNFTSYNNPEVDKLIDQGRMTMDKNKRIEVYKKIYKLIADDAPYAFMFVNKYDLYARRARVQQPKPTFEYGVGIDYWTLEK